MRTNFGYFQIMKIKWHFHNYHQSMGPKSLYCPHLPLLSPPLPNDSFLYFSCLLFLSFFLFICFPHQKSPKKKKKNPHKDKPIITPTTRHKPTNIWNNFFIKLINTNPQSHPQQTQIHHHTMATQTRKCKKEERDRFERWSMWRLERWRSTNPMGFFYK